MNEEQKAKLQTLVDEMWKQVHASHEITAFLPDNDARKVIVKARLEMRSALGHLDELLAV